MKRFVRRLLRTVLFVFLLLNVVAFFHAWKFTHFTNEPGQPNRSYQLSSAEKVKMLFFGISNPKPKNSDLPSQAFEVVKIKSTESLEAWWVPVEKALGTVILFHGYRGEKSHLLDRSDELHKMRYNTLLVDFMGSGGSEGYNTTIGFKEAEQVKDCYQYLHNQGHKNIYLMGASMGAVAIMKALHDYPLDPSAVILECPFGAMYPAVERRIEMMGAPTFPLAGLLTFWGGVQHGFWAFGHNPEEYARALDHPTLLLWGEQDDRVSREEIRTILEHLPGKKKLVTYPNSGHESYLNHHVGKWADDVSSFLRTNR